MFLKYFLDYKKDRVISGDKKNEKREKLGRLWFLYGKRKKIELTIPID
ncbi:MAG: hypothetical protein AB1765_03455 [Candidatus Hydrogenedentota bacterium]